MKKLLVTISMIATLLACSNNDDNQVVEEKETKYNIGVTAIVSHPSLELVKEGFLKAFEDNNIAIEVEEKNANGEVATATLIANSFKAAEKDLSLGIGTPSAQALANNITDKPVLFAAVTDPASASILNDNVTGVSDRLDNIDEHFELLNKILPNAKTIGILYNTSEINSQIQVNAIQEEAHKRGYDVVLQGVTNSSDLVQATNVILENVDAIYVPTDNLVVSGMKFLAEKAIEKGKIVIASENSSVSEGALYTIGLDYYKQGYRVGEMAIDILVNGKNISDIPFEATKETQLYINTNTAKALNIMIDDDILENAVKY